MSYRLRKGVGNLIGVAFINQKKGDDLLVCCFFFPTPKNMWMNMSDLVCFFLGSSWGCFQEEGWIISNMCHWWPDDLSEMIGDRITKWSEMNNLKYMGVSKNKGTPKWMVKIMENPMNKWMIWGGLGPTPPLFLVHNSTPIWWSCTDAPGPSRMMWLFDPLFEVDNHRSLENGKCIPLGFTHGGLGTKVL